MPSRRSAERHERNIRDLRALVDAGSRSVVRDMAASGLPTTRRKYPLPCIGHRSGKLTVTGYMVGARGVRALIVRCDCSPDEYTVDHHNFKDFKSTRCNLCAKQAASKKRYWQYAEVMPNDAHRTRLLNRLSAAITRCHSAGNSRYIHYGARGIKVCDEWRNDRAAFLKYIQTVPGWDDPTLQMDRENNNEGYAPGNIRFATPTQNTRNRRKIAELEAELARLRSVISRAAT